MSVENLTCRTYWKTFCNRTALNTHIKQDHQHEISMQSEDRMINCIQRGLNDLFKCLVPPVRLPDIKDDPGESRAEWNFLMDERNRRVFDGTNWMMDRITESPKLRDRFFKIGTICVGASGP